MKRIAHRWLVRSLFIIAIPSLRALQVCAQEPHIITASDSESVGARAAHIIEQTGGSSFDPEEVFEYLDGLSVDAQSGLSVGARLAGGIQERHADPEMTWSKVLTMQRMPAVLPADSIMHYSIRSRGSSAISAHEQSGFQSGEYLGSPDDISNRVRVRSDAVEVAFLQRKKAWEPQFLDRFDGFAELRNPIPISGAVSVERFVAGDYALAFGNGLLFGGGAGSSRTLSAAAAAEQRAFGLRGTLSSDPNRALRGAAEEIAIGPAGSPTIHVLLFASERPIDARVMSDTIQTIYTSSYHRTQSELALKNTALLRVSGARASIASSDTGRLYIAAGLTGFDARYDHPYDGTPSAPFMGRVMDAIGGDVLAVGRTWSTHLEAAMISNDTSRSFLAAASGLFQPSPNAAVSFLYHHIPYGIASPFGEVSGETAQSLSNSDGFYAGLEVALIPKRLRLSAYADIQSVILPVSDVFGRRKSDVQCATFLSSPEAGFDASVALRQVDGEAMRSSMISGTATLDTIVARLGTIASSATHIRIDASYTVSASLTIKGRYEHVGVSTTGLASTLSESESGSLVLTRVELHPSWMSDHPPRPQVTLALSAARFATDSYASALYLYESGTPGSGAVVLLDGAGYRASLRTTARITRGLSVSVAAGGTIYDVPRTLGSGLTARTGRTAGDVTVQVDLSL